MMIIALIGSSCIGGLVAMLGVMTFSIGVWMGLALYLGIAMTGIVLAMIAQLGRQSQSQFEVSRTA
ncbi:hypothetical protein [Roseivivax sp. CAU 1753]